ncbi:hypothetical protein OG235_37210 [Streptomyces sp. NBC_00024]|uniref:hypothetical protein n=1 Tax=Streptomyces sp. NBC_00024 TaxID=2903612 RepID=UPI0032494EB9
MDLEGIGAISAAAVALVGIPSALLIGRWQMRAALRTAEETGRAGIAQAEATYRSALDAVHASALTAHTQWRRSAQRDAYAALLLATTQVVEAAESMPTDVRWAGEAEVAAREADYSKAKTALSSALYVVKLEGPDDLTGLASRVSTHAHALAAAYKKRASIRWTQTKLEKLHEEVYTTHGAADDSSAPTPPHALGRALNRVSNLVRQHGIAVTRTSEEHWPSDLAEAAAELHRHLRTVERHLSLDERSALITEAFQGYPGTTTLDRNFAVANEDFVKAAREELDRPPRKDWEPTT